MPGVNGQLVEQTGIEPGGLEQTAVGVPQQIEAQRHKRPIPSDGDAGARNIKRDRPDAFVRIGIDFLCRMQNGDGTVSDEIVHSGDAPAMIRSVSSHGGPSARQPPPLGR